MLYSIFSLLLFIRCAISNWTNAAYPDIRGRSTSKCSVVVPLGSLYYICDPDHVINASEASALNVRLHQLAIGTPCPCQRRSQCALADNGHEFHGFVVSVAMVNTLQMPVHSPSETQLNNRAASFCRNLQGRWALGDCGNSVLVFVWKHYTKLVIWPGRLADRYVTINERQEILDEINPLIQNGRWFEALSRVIDSLHRKLKGEPKTRFDVGTLSLITAVGVACLISLFVTICVCAFRFCGNLGGAQRHQETQNRHLRKLSHAIKHGSQIRRSLSRSPKYSTRDSPINGVFPETQTTTVV